MSIVQQGPAVDASATVRGLMNFVAQTFGGVKTFNNKIVIASQGGSEAAALEFSSVLDEIRWPTDYGNVTLTGWTLGGEPAHYSKTAPFRTNSGTGFVIGGVLTSFGTGGITCSAGSASPDLYQAQTSYPVSLRSEKGASAGVVWKLGTSQASPDASAELLRVGYGLGPYFGSDGTPVFKVLGGNRIIAGAAASAPTDADLMAGSVSFYLDEAGNNLKVRAKYSGGTLKTATIPLV